MLSKFQLFAYSRWQRNTGTLFNLINYNICIIYQYNMKVCWRKQPNSKCMKLSKFNKYESVINCKRDIKSNYK